MNPVSRCPSFGIVTHTHTLNPIGESPLQSTPPCGSGDIPTTMHVNAVSVLDCPLLDVHLDASPCRRAVKSVFKGLTPDATPVSSNPTPPRPPTVDIDLSTSVVGQLDTAADVSVTQLKQFLHGYQAFVPSSLCPVVLVPADGTKITPVGVGFLRIPAPSHRGYYDILAYYSPAITRLC
jgi:hypothetical protein